MARAKRDKFITPPPYMWPEHSVRVLAGQFNLALGEHPDALRRDALSQLYPLLTDEQHTAELLPALQKYGLPLGPDQCGHHTLRDETYAHFAGTNTAVPIAPLYVRDLAGRVICTGIGGAMTKQFEDFPTGPTFTFPEGCFDVGADVPGAELIENVFFTHWRTLDMSWQATTSLTGQPEAHAIAAYNNPQHYPYKLRPDTFYQDGWRLPQTIMVYARRHGISKTDAEAAAAELMAAWAARPQGQGYEEFYEANNGETWYEELFLRGCTVMPTFEAANGFNQVNEQFELEDFWPGRAILGLHEVVEERESDAPVGTILEVVKPGYVTGAAVKQAQVIVSDGSKYVSAHSEQPEPLYADIRLPHQRTSDTWFDVWIPTHPKHFEPPALWGWQLSTGRFVQLSGPIWDPLHYNYASTPLLRRAMRQPYPDNPSLAAVPEEMKTRFYPVVPFEGFEALNHSTYTARQQENLRPLSGVDRVRTGEQSAGIGYHPLPLQLEYELDHAWFPQLLPTSRLDSLPDEEDLDKLAPVITPQVDASAYLKSCRTTEQAPWVVDRVQPSADESEKPYPHLLRYTNPDAADEAVFAAHEGLLLAHVPESELKQSIQQLLGDPEVQAELDALQAGLYDAFYDFRERAQQLRQIRHKLWRKAPGQVLLGHWYGVALEELMQLVDELGDPYRQQGMQVLLQQVVGPARERGTATGSA
jgi:hypothetical protein